MQHMNKSFLLRGKSWPGRVENINCILDISNGKVEELILYNQLLEHLENGQQ